MRLFIFNVKINAPVDSKLMRAIKALNENRLSMLELDVGEVQTNSGLVNLLNNIKLKNILIITLGKLLVV